VDAGREQRDGTSLPPVYPLQARPGRRWAGRVMALVVLATVAALALPAGLAPAASPASAVAATAQPVLRTGSRGAAVVYLQRRLANLHTTWAPSTGSSATPPTTAWSPSRKSMAWPATGSSDHEPGTPWPTQ
jgi:hypothetical protein